MHSSAKFCAHRDALTGNRPCSRELTGAQIGKETVKEVVELTFHIHFAVADAHVEIYLRHNAGANAQLFRWRVRADRIGPTVGKVQTARRVCHRSTRRKRNGTGLTVYGVPHNSQICGSSVRKNP